MKALKVFCTVTVLSLAAGVAQAATEYLRFSGKIDNNYGPVFFSGYDASLGFAAGQTIYFDFQVNTSLTAAGYADSPYRHNFAVTYLAGSIVGPNMTHGVTNMYPEGITTDLFVTSSLMVGMVAGGSQYGDVSIDTWDVGSTVSLMNGGDYFSNVIGNLKLTYRGASLPPANVPIPTAFWLFVSGVGSSLLLKRGSGAFNARTTG